MTRQEIENKIQKLVERLDNGEKIIDKRKEKNLPVGEQETLYIKLLAEYVALQKQYVTLVGCSFEHYLLTQGV